MSKLIEEDPPFRVEYMMVDGVRTQAFLPRKPLYIQQAGRGRRRVPRVVAFIDVGAIVVDKYPINLKTLELVRHLEAGGEVSPIKVAKLPGGGFKLCDGRHRVTAFKLLGRETIEAKYSTATLRQLTPWESTDG